MWTRSILDHSSPNLQHSFPLPFRKKKIRDSPRTKRGQGQVTKSVNSLPFNYFCAIQRHRVHIYTELTTEKYYKLYSQSVPEMDVIKVMWPKSYNYNILIFRFSPHVLIVHRDSQKNKTTNSCPYFHQTLTNFQNSFTATRQDIFNEEVITRPSKPQKYPTLSCKILVFRNCTDQKHSNGRPGAHTMKRTWPL